jgi:DNA-binding MarR family transcriptional regulator
LTNDRGRAMVTVVHGPGLTRLLLEAFRSLDDEVIAALRDRGIPDLRPSQALALLLVDRTGTRLSVLAQRADVSKQAMMQLVDELAEIGCLRRTPDPADARAKIVRLTAKGLRHRAAARKAIASVESRARRRLGDRRFDALRGTLQELVAAEA